MTTWLALGMLGKAQLAHAQGSVRVDTRLRKGRAS